MANNCSLGVDGDDIGEFLEVVAEELTGERLLELEQERIAEEEARLCRRKRTPKSTHSEGFSRSFCRPQQAP